MHLTLHKKVLANDTFNLLIRLNKTNALKSFYLVGGTALALLLNHRESIDLDFFSQEEFDSNLLQNINEDFEVLSLHKNSIEAIVNDTKVMFFYFAFPRFKDLINVKGIRMADPVDIGLMKLLALQGRATKKDIIDLYFIDKEVIKLNELLDIFQSYYPKEKFNSYDSLKTLLDKDTLLQQPMPRMIEKIEWEECYNEVSKKIIEYFSEVIKVHS